MDYQEIGAYAVNIHYDYNRAIDKYNELVEEREKLNRRINKLNEKKHRQEYERLCSYYREVVAGINSNIGYRQSLFDKLNRFIDENGNK